MPQLRPDADVTVSLLCSTGSTHYALIDETFLATSDYVYIVSSTANQTPVTGSDLVGCTTLTKAGTLRKVIAWFNMGWYNAGGLGYPATGSYIIKLYTGTTELATANKTTADVGWQSITYTGDLTQSEIDALRMYVYMTVTSGYDGKSIYYQGIIYWYMGYLDICYADLTKTVTLNACLQAKDVTATVTLNACLSQADITKTIPLSACLLKQGETKAIPLSACLLKPDNTITLGLSACLMTTDDVSLDLNACLLQVDNTKAIPLSAALLKQNDTRSIPLDAYIVIRENLSIDLDAVLKLVGAKTLDLSAIIVSRPTVTLDLNAVVVDRKTKPVDLDSLMIVRNTKTVDLDSIIVARNTKMLGLSATLSQINIHKTIDLAAVIGTRLKSVKIWTTPYTTITYDVRSYNMDVHMPGSTAYIRFRLYDVDNNPVDPNTVNVSVYDPSGEKIVDSAACNKLSNGYYEYTGLVMTDDHLAGQWMIVPEIIDDDVPTRTPVKYFTYRKIKHD